jgi:hypothetical protein
VCEHRRARSGARRQLFDLVGEAREVLLCPLERGERVPPGLVRQGDGHLGAAGERFQERPLGPGQILEPVGEHGPALPGLELPRNALCRVAALELPVPEAEPVELLAIARVELSQLAVELARLEERGLELRDRRAEGISEPREPGGSTELGPGHDAPQQQAPLRACDHRPMRAVRPRQPCEQVVEGADRAAHERARFRKQFALGPVDVRPVRHDQERIGLERAQIAFEEKRHLSGVGWPCEQAEAHRAHPSNVGRRSRRGGRSRPSRRISSGRDCGLRPAAPPRDGLAGKLPGAVVAEIGLLRAAAGVGEVEAHHRAFSFLNFAAAVVADEHGLASQVDLLSAKGKPSLDFLVERILRSFPRPPNSMRTK